MRSTATRQATRLYGTCIRYIYVPVSYDLLLTIFDCFEMMRNIVYNRLKLKLIKSLDISIKEVYLNVFERLNLLAPCWAEGRETSSDAVRWCTQSGCHVEH